MNRTSLLVSATDLVAELGRPGLSIIDASWYLPAHRRDPRREFEASHIPGAVFFDQDAVVDPTSPLPHALPDEATFAAALSVLGVADTDRIVVYDGMGFFSAPRVWWMLRSFGAGDVRVLDGGFPAWIAAGGPVESGPATPRTASFRARLDRAAVVGLPEMRRIVDERSRQVVDARPADRFRAEAPEPRAGVRGGHMPGARSLPLAELAQDGRLRDPDALHAAFAAAGVDPARPVVASCGSGVTAAAVLFALASMGHEEGRLYDGSWTEWGSDPSTPVETGPAR